MPSPRILPKGLTGSEHLLGTHCETPSLVGGVVLTKITLEDEYSLGLAWLSFTLTSPNRDMQATTTMSKQFGLLYNDPLLKREIVASLGPVRPSLLTRHYVPL
jgi:hypothetical protein